MTYGMNQLIPCKKIAIDILTDVATQFMASQFFFDKRKISDSMQKQLNGTFAQYCYATVDYFQLKSIDLPDKYEMAIQETETMKQDIHKADAEKQKMAVELQTKIMQAQISSNVNINQAEASGQSFFKIQTQQAQSLAEIKRTLGFDNNQLLGYLRAKILKEYPEDKMIIGID